MDKVEKIFSAFGNDDLLLIIICIITITIMLHIKLAQDKFFKTTPIGETREYIQMISWCIGFALACTNIDGKIMKIQFGFFQIKR